MYDFRRTLKKALVSTGVFVVASVLMGGAMALQNVEALEGIWASTGPLALIIIPAIVFGGRTLEDWLKHRKQ